MAQEQSEQTTDIPDRLRAVRVKLQVPWDELAEILQLSKSMLYQVASGRRRLGSLSMGRLEKLELLSGEQAEQLVRKLDSSQFVERVTRLMSGSGFAKHAKAEERVPGEFQIQERISNLRIDAAVYRATAEEHQKKARRCLEQAAELEGELQERIKALSKVRKT